jgi:hypothetical protein
VVVEEEEMLVVLLVLVVLVEEEMQVLQEQLIQAEVEEVDMEAVHPLKQVVLVEKELLY